MCSPCAFTTDMLSVTYLSALTLLVWRQEEPPVCKYSVIQ